MMGFWAEYYKYIAIAILAGVIIDIVVGDPAFLLHPVQIIGKLIEILEMFLRGKKVTKSGGYTKENAKAGSNSKDFVLGVIEVIVVVAVTGGVSFGICYLAYRINTYLLLVGRDTQSLDDKGIAKAAVETVAENTNDGVICPLFYQMLGGPVLSYVYKAVSTMDSLLGYKNDRYMYFGRFAAKTDDVFAYIPARLSAVFMIAGTALLEVCGALFGKKNAFNYSTKNAAGIFVRDRYNHASPNSAQCESVCAGALGLKLAGPASYFGKRVEKPTLGDNDRPIERKDVRRANALMYGASIFLLILFETIGLPLAFWGGIGL